LENQLSKEDKVIGCLLGTGIGDAIGLPCEGLTKKRLKRLYPQIDKHHFFFGKGMFSDDTEHTCMLSQTLIKSKGETEIFQKVFANKLKFWFLALPAGIGLATLKAIFKLLIGFNPSKSGVFSAGNGPAMRSSILGVCYGDNFEKLKELNKISTNITHIDPKAEIGALTVALTAYIASIKKDISPDEYYDYLTEKLDKDSSKEFLEIIKKVIESVKNNDSTEIFAESIGLGKGVTGYIYHTVPIVIHCWLKNQNDYKKAITEIIFLGGDTDTTAAILGGIIGSSVGKQGIPTEWLNNIIEKPRDINHLEELGKRLSKSCFENIEQKEVKISLFLVLLRNLFFLIVVLFHGFRRLFPPY